MTGYLSVKNWEKFQHYQKGKNKSASGPPWIKLYTRLLDSDDYEYYSLSDQSKLVFIHFMLLASRHDNKVPYDHDWIANRLNIRGSINLQELVDSGFIVVNGNPRKILGTSYDNPRVNPRTEVEVDKEEDLDTDKDPPIVPQRGRREIAAVNPLVKEIFTAWNVMAKQHGLPTAKPESRAYAKNLKKALSDPDFIEHWREAIGKVHWSPHNVGQNDRGWKADMEWFLREGKVLKIIGYGKPRGKNDYGSGVDEEVPF